MSAQRGNYPYQEYFLVASGNQAMMKAGNLAGTGATFNIADGQLGMVCADPGNATLGFNDFLTGGETAQEIPVVRFVQGTPNSPDTSEAYGWPSDDNGIVRSFPVKGDEVISVTARHYQIPTYSSLALTTLATPEDDTNYGIIVTMQSTKFGRSHRGEKVVSAVFNTGTISATVEKDWMLQNLLYRLNLQSKKVRGNDPFVALAINTGGANGGTPIGPIALGDVIPFMVYDGTTYNLVADATLIQTIYNWIDSDTFTADATIVPINLSTAGSAVAATGTITITAFGSLGTDTVTVNGTALVEGTDWAAGGSNNAAATALAAEIDGIAGVSAVANGAVITVTAETAGAAGNSIAMTYTSGGTIGLTLSGATLEGGDSTNVDAVVIMGLGHQLPRVHNGLPAKMVDVSKSKFSHGFTADSTLVTAKCCDAREPLGSGAYLLMAYDERAAGQRGLTYKNGPADTLLQMKKYIDPDTNYTAVIIDCNTVQKNMEFPYRVFILVPGTDDSASATAADGIEVTTNAANTESDLNNILTDWLDSIVGIKYIGQAEPGTVIPA